MPRHRTGLLFGFAALALAIGFFGSVRAQGQAIPAASRSVGFSAFGGYSYVHPDFGPSIANNNGFFAGVDITRFIDTRRIRSMAVSLEGRVDYSSGATVRETTYQVGGKVEKTYLRRYHPYADFLVGPGNIHWYVYPQYWFEPGDNSIVYSYGPGVDIDLSHNWGFKADYQFTHWKIGNGDTLTPGILNVGVKYNLPFRSKYRSRDLR